MGIFSRLLPPLVCAYGGQAIAAAIFVPQQSEMYFDLCGALGFLSTTFVSLYYPSLRDKFYYGKSGPLPAVTSFAPRQILMTGCLTLWSARLGSFLLARAWKAGGDTRFEKIKRKPLVFAYCWMAQATWVFLVGLPAYLVNTLPPHAHTSLRPRDYISLSLFASSFLFEVIADRQKTIWRIEKAAKKHEEQFISRGLWSISRHPNYVGEVGIWTGIWALSTASLQSPYYPKFVPIVAAASPLFTYLLTRHVSGVPPLERAGDKKFSTNPKWQEYKSTVPVFWPWGTTK